MECLEDKEKEIFQKYIYDKGNQEILLENQKYRLLKQEVYFPTKLVSEKKKIEKTNGEIVKEIMQGIFHTEEHSALDSKTYLHENTHSQYWESQEHQG